jgi:hypothetical protein
VACLGANDKHAVAVEETTSASGRDSVDVKLRRLDDNYRIS